MSKALVVVESPAKAKTIEKFLGKNFFVKASMGHLRDLPKSQFGVDIENNFEPKYINIRGKGDLIKSLKSAAKNAEKVYLATDPDREGEAIAWHLAHILDIPLDKACRIEFNEITKPAVQKAIKNPRNIDLPRVLAQQARRVLDRIVGYKLSPLLWRKVKKGLSAGRVQSVAVRIICDREKEILAFIPEEYWTIITKLKEKSNTKPFEAMLILLEGKKISIENNEQADKITSELKQAEYIVDTIKKRERKRSPGAPFTTSSLQQEASRRLGFTSKKTMMIAQQLYEGIELGKLGHVGLITYMRTDSTRITESAQQEARVFITEKYGDVYLPEKPPIYVTKKAQDAHEAIRPTTMEFAPEDIAKHLSKEQYKLYKLIFERFLQSQMLPAVYDTLTIDIKAGKYTLRAVGSKLKFPGYQIVNGKDSSKKKKEELDISENDDSIILDNDKPLPELEVGQKLILDDISSKQHFTEPPSRFNEASLVKIMEEKGIGRPSTYAPTIETILARGYVKKVEKFFQPTELGFVVVDLLREYFKEIVDVEFTAGMEGNLDDIADGEESWTEILDKFYQPFSKELSHAEQEIGQVELSVEVSDVECDLCGRFMVVKQGRFGSFLACPGYPECRNTKPIVKTIGVNCPKCEGEIIQRKSKKGRVFYGCNKYPKCDFVTWDEPLQETCSVCGAFKVKSKFRNKAEQIKCSNENCSENGSEKKEDVKSKKRSKKNV